MLDVEKAMEEQNKKASTLLEQSSTTVLEFWSTPRKTEGIHPDTISALSEHYDYYLGSLESPSILELGAAENSYLPPSVTPSRHVGIGLNPTLMESNPSLTERLSIDLNDVEEGVGLTRSPSMMSLASGGESFDVVIMANTIGFLTRPLEVFRTASRLLKPGGVMIVSFCEKDQGKQTFEEVWTRWWRTMTDDQHLWVAGSFFQFSAGGGWRDLKGFDITPPSDASNFLQQKLEGKTKMFVVQGTKEKPQGDVNYQDPEGSFLSAMWMTPRLEQRDKELLAPRLGRAWEQALTADMQDRIFENVKLLPEIYKVTDKMDAFEFPFNLKAQLACLLVSDMGYDGCEEQIANLREGLGLNTPGPFWSVIGERTSAMTPEDKIILLAHLVPRFGGGGDEKSGSVTRKRGLDDFLAGLEPTFQVVRGKCLQMSEADVQLLGTEYLAADILPGDEGVSTKREFALWLEECTQEEHEEVLGQRKAFQAASRSELEMVKRARVEQEEREKREQQELEEQRKNAEDNRSMAFNPETGKMEEISK